MQGHHTFAHDPQRVDVEAGVGLVEDGQVGLEHRHLQDLGPLLLAAAEAIVEVAPGEGVIDLEHGHGLAQGLAEDRDRHALGRRRQHPAVRGSGLGLDPRVERGPQEVGNGHTWDCDRILEGEEQAKPAAFIGFHLQDVLALEKRLTLGDFVVGMTHQGIGEGALATPVRAHDGVNLARVDGQVETLEDLLAAFDLDVQVANFEPLVRHCCTPENRP